MSPSESNRLDRRQLIAAAGGWMVGVPAARAADDVMKVLHSRGLPASGFGALFDGRTDNSSALQHGIDAAAKAGQPLALPPGVARISVPLDLKGRNISVVGDPIDGSILRAASSIDCLIDCEETRDVIDSPLYLYGLTLDGNGMARAGLRLRYRHRTVFNTVTAIGCEVGIDEVDSWLGRRVNCKVRSNGTGWRLRGANHSSIWSGCSFTDARTVHLDIGSNGTAKDGNQALLFQACDIEYGAGDGIAVANGASATFDTCYIGENIGGDILRSAGKVLIRGGALFIGYGEKGLGISVSGGAVSVYDVSVRGQKYGALDRLAGASGSGAVTFERVDMQVELGGDPALTGDVLGTAPMRVFAPIQGRGWAATSYDAAAEDTSKGNERTVNCRRVTGPRPLIGLAAEITNGQLALHGNGYIVIAYTASKPVSLKLTSGPMSKSPWMAIGTLPATADIKTFVKCDIPITYADYSFVELIMEAAPGERLTLYHASFSDSGMINPAPLSNLARAR